MDDLALTELHVDLTLTELYVDRALTEPYIDLTRAETVKSIRLVTDPKANMATEWMRDFLPSRRCN